MSDTFRYASVSGGKDSTAVYIWCIEQFGKDGFRAVSADTRHEHPVTINYIKNMHLFFDGPVVEIVSADFSEKLASKGKLPSKMGETFQDLIVWKGRAPSAKAQFCTEHLKMHPIRDWIFKNRGEKPSIGYVGIRHQESARRSKMPREILNEFMDSLTVHPIIDWKEDEVISFVRRHGPLNPLYENGSARVGCYPCIHARKKELANMPDWAWERLERYERSVNKSWFAPNVVPVGLKKEHIPTLDEVRNWSKTKFRSRELDETIDEKDVPSCMASWGVCE